MAGSNGLAWTIRHLSFVIRPLPMPPEICPHCGAKVPPNAKACPECGADEETGWSEEARYGGLDLPDEEFDCEEFTRREFGGKKAIPHGMHWLWWLIGLLVAVALIMAWVK